jgi:hypothetical protein
MEKRFSSLSDPRWADAICTLICHSGDRYFRWHDSGDLKDLEHLRQIARVCLNLPRVKFWLPTREYQTVEAYRRMGGQIPPNLCIRYSAHLVDGPPPLHYGLPTSVGVFYKSFYLVGCACLPCTQAKQRLRQLQGLLESSGQIGELSPEMGFRRVQTRRAITHDRKGERWCALRWISTLLITAPCICYIQTRFGLKSG